MSSFNNLATSIRYDNVSKELSKIYKVQMKLDRNIIERKISRKRPKLSTCQQHCCLTLGVVLSGKKTQAQDSVHTSGTRHGQPEVKNPCCMV